MDIEAQYDRLLRYCIVKVRHREIAEDIVQETFLRFLSSHSYQAMGKEMAYLYTIARNLCMDTFRRQSKEIPSEEMPEEIPDGQEDLADSMMIRLAMDTLSEEDRELIALRYLSELSVSEIGKITGQSRFTIYRRLSAAVKGLKQELEG